MDFTVKGMNVRTYMTFIVTFKAIIDERIVYFPVPVTAEDYEKAEVSARKLQNNYDNEIVAVIDNRCISIWQAYKMYSNGKRSLLPYHYHKSLQDAYFAKYGHLNNPIPTKLLIYKDRTGIDRYVDLKNSDLQFLKKENWFVSLMKRLMLICRL